MTSPYYADDRATVLHGDCLELMAAMPGASFDAIVTDPPYGLGFMGKAWDSLPPGIEWAAECLRILKPGGHLLAFGGSRTWHRLACAVEDAGFEIRDSIAWLYGSGFPKSLDVSKAIDKDNGRKFEDRFALGRHIRERRESLGLARATVNGWLGAARKAEHYESESPGFARVPTLADWHILRDRLNLSDEHLPLVERAEAEREVIGVRKAGKTVGSHAGEEGAYGFRSEFDVTAPATPDAERWHGWGTALKPAFEPVVMARKPLMGTVASNVLAFGTGALNVDGCRIGHADPSDLAASLAKNPGRSDSVTSGVYGANRPQQSVNTAGRWPANVVLDESQAEALDQQSGESRDGVAVKRNGVTSNGVTGWGKAEPGTPDAGGYGGQGGASRFFYVAKAPQSERPKVNGIAHPTVKPLTFMQWLIRLVTPPGGLILDPFAGSGTTVEAALRERVRITAIEREADYLPLILHRIERHEDAPEPEPSLFDLEQPA